jgi:high affinity sulfate transporter 1
VTSRLSRLVRLAPGLEVLARYRRSDFPHDLAAGLAVTAVAVPMAVANAQLAGFSPVVGLYASMLPMIAYALFGTSRQLLVGPSAVSGALVAAGVAPLAGSDVTRYLELATALTLITGFLCVGASLLRLGAIADLLSKPILVGFMNGVAISVVLSQIGRLFGISIEASGILPRAWEFAGKLTLTHWPTLLVGLGTMAVLVAAPRVVKPLPAALLGMVAAAVVVRVLGLEQAGVATIGPVPGGLPALRMPWASGDELPVLVAEAAGLALVTFSNTMVAARSFADRNRYEIDSDKEIAALGAANIAAAISQGFAVNGSSSRAAVGEAAGGRTQLTGIIAAAGIAVVLVAFTRPLQYIPAVSLAAVLVITGASLFDWAAMAAIRRIDRREFWIALTATIGVVAVGVMNGILVAVVLALLSFVALASRPKVEILGQISGQPGFHSIARHPEATTLPGLVLFRFNGAVIFFSAPYFKREVLQAAAAAGPGLKWFIIDLAPVNLVDATGIAAIQEVFDELRARGVVAGGAGRQAEWADWADKRGLSAMLSKNRFFKTLGQAAAAYQTEVTGHSVV